MIPALKEGFPALSDDLSRLENALKEKKIAVYDYFKAGQDNGEAVINAWAASFSISTATIGLAMHQVSRIILEKRAGAVAELLPDGVWEKGYCPICGAFPSLSVIKEKLGERLLHCSHCGHNWRFSRVTCPYCEHEGQKGMDFFFIEDKAQEAAFTCEKCQRYLVTLSRMSDLNDRDLDVSAMGLAHLDMIMQEKKFVPMALTDWNVF
jgi:FdhE protein